MEVRRSGSRHNTNNVVASRSTSKKHHTFKPNGSSLKKKNLRILIKNLFDIGSYEASKYIRGLIQQKHSSKNL